MAQQAEMMSKLKLKKNLKQCSEREKKGENTQKSQDSPEAAAAQ